VHRAWPPCDPHAPLCSKSRIGSTNRSRCAANGQLFDRPKWSSQIQSGRGATWSTCCAFRSAIFTNCILRRLRTRAGRARAPQVRAPMARQTVEPSFGGICRGDWIRHEQGDRHSCPRVEHALARALAWDVDLIVAGGGRAVARWKKSKSNERIVESHKDDRFH